MALAGLTLLSVCGLICASGILVEVPHKLSMALSSLRPFHDINCIFWSNRFVQDLDPACRCSRARDPAQPKPPSCSPTGQTRSRGPCCTHLLRLDRYVCWCREFCVTVRCVCMWVCGWVLLKLRIYHVVSTLLRHCYLSIGGIVPL